MNTAVSEVVYTARDKNAKRGSRVHEVRLNDGSTRAFTFPSDAARVEVPVDVAISLSRIPSFEVMDSRGLIVVPQQIEEQTNLGEVVSLAADQVIANLSELTKEALVSRANDLGAGFKSNHAKEAVIKFIVDYNIQNPGSSADSEEVLDITEEGGL